MKTRGEERRRKRDPLPMQHVEGSIVAVWAREEGEQVRLARECACWASETSYPLALRDRVCSMALA